jgi:hypothetical protein
MPVNGKEHHTVERSKLGQFLPGHKSIGGRKKGSRNLLSEQFLSDLHAEWKRSGKRVLEKVARDQPETFLRVCSAVLPRLIDIDGQVNIRSELSVEVQDFATAYRLWGQHIGVKGLPLIEAEVVEEVVEDDDDSTDTDG